VNTSLLQSQLPGAEVARGKKSSRERGHRIRVFIAAASSLALLAVISIYGASYYVLPLDQRPYSDKHELLKPSGTIGLKLGILGTVLFFIIFLYALRKVIPWLGRWGTARHWMDFHVIAGLTAPVVVAYHASFKFQGIAGFAFWIMVAVALSGVIGRYLYSQIPRSLSAAELSLNELRNNEQELARALLTQSIYSAEQLSRALRMPAKDRIKRISPLRALAQMIALDLGLPFRVARLRRASCRFGTKVLSIGGLISIGNPEVEQIVRLVRKKAVLSRRIVFLDQTQQVFHLWHVVHRPFSYAFAVLVIVHIVVVTGLGFIPLGFH
jgi:hypothetical protein